MNQSTKQANAHELGIYLRRLEDKAIALSAYEIDPQISFTDLILFTLSIYDTPDRAVDPALLKDVYTLSGQFGLVAIEGAISDTPPYVHLGNYGDALDRLQRDGHISVNGNISLTDTGIQIGSAILATYISKKPY